MKRLNNKVLAYTYLVACRPDALPAVEHHEADRLDRLGGVVEIEGNASGMCAITSERRVYCWGTLYGGPRFSETSVRPRRIEGADGVVWIDWSGGWIGGLPDETVVAWPAKDLRPRREDEKGDRPSLWPGLDEDDASPWVALPTGYPKADGRRIISQGQGSAWVLRDGAVSCERCVYGVTWGEGAKGRITGVADLRDVVHFARLGVPDLEDVDAACVLHSSGRLECLDANRRFDVPLPAAARQISESGGMGILLEDGRIYTMDYEFGLHREPRVPAAVRIERDEGYMCAITNSGDVWCWLDPVFANEKYVPPDPARREGIENAIDVVVGPDSGCALVASGNVLCWGANENGECGIGRITKEWLTKPEFVVAPQE